MLAKRCPQACARAIEHFNGDAVEGTAKEINEAITTLKREGFVSMPGWEEIKCGQRPEPSSFAEQGEWQHGWQFSASSNREHFFRRRTVMATSDATDLAHLRSRSGPGAAAVFGGCPTTPEFTIDANIFRALVLDRVRLPLPLMISRCAGCGFVLDERGFHCSACTKSGLLRKRASPTEKMLARICREAGSVVKTNVLLRDLNITCPAKDQRQIEVIANGLPCYNGAQLAVDMTLRSSISAKGEARGRAAYENGHIADAARRDKEQKYPELLTSKRCRLIVVALEIGGRWSSEAWDFFENLAWARSRSSTPLLRRAAMLAWQRRWIRMLSIASASAWMESLVFGYGWEGWRYEDGAAPELADVLSCEARGG